jgi:hypothetical protein
LNFHKKEFFLLILIFPCHLGFSSVINSSGQYYHQENSPFNYGIGKSQNPLTWRLIFNESSLFSNGSVAESIIYNCVLKVNFWNLTTKLSEMDYSNDTNQISYHDLIFFDYSIQQISGNLPLNSSQYYLQQLFDLNNTIVNQEKIARIIGGPLSYLSNLLLFFVYPLDKVYWDNLRQSSLFSKNGSVQEDEENYNISFNEKLSVRTKDGSVIVYNNIKILIGKDNGFFTEYQKNTFITGGPMFVDYILNLSILRMEDFNLDPQLINFFVNFIFFSFGGGFFGLIFAKIVKKKRVNLGKN